MKKVLLLIAVVSMAAFASAQDDEITADKIIDTYFENTGGKDNWRKLEGTKTTAKVNAQGMEIPIEIISLKDGRQRMKMELQGKEIVQGSFDGETMWSHNFMTMAPEKSDDETIENMKRSAAKEFPDPFLDYADKGFKTEYVGKETVEGAECFKVKLTQTPILVDGKEEENVTYYYFDAENYVPILTESEMKSGPAKGMMVQAVMSDYQEVDGLYFPFSFMERAKGGEGQAVTFEKIELNPKVKDNIFDFPGDKDADKAKDKATPGK